MSRFRQYQVQACLPLYPRGQMCRVVRLVRAIRKGWIKLHQEPAKDAEEPYLLWADDGQASDKTPAGLSYIAPPKPQLPGHEESYHPPAEYLPSEVSAEEQQPAATRHSTQSCEELTSVSIVAHRLHSAVTPELNA